MIRQRTIDLQASDSAIRACLRKIRHRTEEKALIRAARAISRNGCRRLRVYRCPACRGWHLTSKVRRRG